MTTLHYEEDLVEAAVFLGARGRQPGVPALQVSRFHHEREQLYRILDPDERNTAFFKLNLDWFREWGLEAMFTGLLKEYPLLPALLDSFAVRKARGKQDEGAELFVNETGQRNAVVALRPERFEHEDRLRGFLRHEFTHLSDMVDPAFGYSPGLTGPAHVAAQQRLARERYRVLWDISIDGRLTAAGHEPSATREQHWAAFARGYAFWPPEKQAQVFDALWRDDAPRHAALVELATDPRGVRDEHQAMPGAACPLCGFPTFDWIALEHLTPAMVSAITAEFPGWTPVQRLCGRCHEVYEVAVRQAGVPAPPG